MKQVLPHHVTEHIMERLGAKSLIRFKSVKFYGLLTQNQLAMSRLAHIPYILVKVPSHNRCGIFFTKSVSKQWRSTIRSPCFRKRQLIHHSRRDDPDVLLICVHDPSVFQEGPGLEDLRRLVVGSGSSSSVSLHIPTGWEDKSYLVCNTSCDGLICLYDLHANPGIVVVNPMTRWHQTFPKSNYQLVAADMNERGEMFEVTYPSLGFGKDKICGIYKPVWLYNSAELGLNDKATTCEVFDFASNAWRYIVPASPHLILHMQDPVYVDGSLHWFTALSPEGETMVLSLDLHTEPFQVISKAPFLHASLDDMKIAMCNLDGRLCVSQEKCPNQVIWSLDGSDHKTWIQIYSIDLNITSAWFGKLSFAYTPLAVLNKDKLLFYDREHGNALITHDPDTKSYDMAYTSTFYATAIAYFPSLISIL